MLNRKVGLQHLLRALYEWNESYLPGNGENNKQSSSIREISWEELSPMRSWSAHRLRKLLRRTIRYNLVSKTPSNSFRLTETGLIDARRIVRNHRLWEIYLITHADIAPSKVDRDADQIEHVLGKVMVDKLEKIASSWTSSEPNSNQSTCVIAAIA